MLISSAFKVILIIFSLESCTSLNICGNWVQYKDTKCIKVIEKKVTEKEAALICGDFENDSSLITIHSKEEQEFFNNLLIKYNSISIYAWIGMNYYNGSYEWLDGTDTKYTNWEDDAVKDGTEPCVQMSLAKTNLGKWLDESCKRTALIVCQKKQIFTLNILREALEALEKKVEVPGVPLGFLYTQLPNQLAPDELWPHLNWTDVTEQYAGLFFRAEGNNNITAPFGQVQNSNQSTIAAIEYYGYNSYGYSVGTEGVLKVTNGWNKVQPTYGTYSFGIHMTTGDVRPINTAVRIWKRI